MKGRTTLTLCAVALLLASFVFFWERQQPGTDQRNAEVSKLVPGLDPESVTRVRIVRPETTVELRKQADSWRLEAPLQDQADQLVVQGLVRDLVEAKTFTRVNPAEVEGGEAAAGLTASAPSIELEQASKRLRFRLGTTPLPGGRRFIAIDDLAQWAIVDDILVKTFERPVEALRDHALFRAATIDVNRFRVETPQSELAFERRGSESWWIQAPLEDAADSAAVTSFLSKLLASRAERFLDQPPASLPVADRAWLNAEFFDQDGKSIGSLTIGDAVAGDPGVARYALTSSRAEPFQIRASELTSDLSKPPESWRSRLALDVSIWDLREVELRVDDKLLLVQRLEEDGKKVWKAIEPAGFSLDTTRWSELLNKLARVEAKRLMDDLDYATSGLGTPRKVVTLRHDDPARVPDHVLMLGQPAGADEVFAGTPGRNTVLVLERQLADELSLEWLTQASPPPTTTAPSTSH
jgi:hypothetical protein